jgi:hypothetical protein
MAKFAGEPLQYWSSTETAYFVQGLPLTIPAGRPLVRKTPFLSHFYIEMISLPRLGLGTDIGKARL